LLYPDTAVYRPYTYVIKPEETGSSDLGSGFYKSNLVCNRYYMTTRRVCVRAYYIYMLCTPSKRRFIANYIWHNIALQVLPRHHAYSSKAVGECRKLVFFYVRVFSIFIISDRCLYGSLHREVIQSRADWKSRLYVIVGIIIYILQRNFDTTHSLLGNKLLITVIDKS